MTRITRTIAAAALAGTIGGLALASTADAGSVSPPEPVYEAPEECRPLDTQQLDVDVQRSGVVRFVYPNDGYITCNEAIVVSSYASASNSVDNHWDPLIHQRVVHVADVEMAGRRGVAVRVRRDQCFSGIEIHLDGDTLLYSDVVGDGCEMTIDTDFVGAAHSADIHVVQQTGHIQPPHMWTIAADDHTVLTGLPHGTWYVKVYDGWTPGSSIEANGSGEQVVSTVYDVADGSLVEIEIQPKAWIGSKVACR